MEIYEVVTPFCKYLSEYFQSSLLTHGKNGPDFGIKIKLNDELKHMLLVLAYNRWTRPDTFSVYFKEGAAPVMLLFYFDLEGKIVKDGTGYVCLFGNHPKFDKEALSEFERHVKEYFTPNSLKFMVSL